MGLQRNRRDADLIMSKVLKLRFSFPPEKNTENVRAQKPPKESYLAYSSILAVGSGQEGQLGPPQSMSSSPWFCRPSVQEGGGGGVGTPQFF